MLPRILPEAGGESPLKCSPPPIGGEHQHLYPSGFSPPGGESEADGGRTEDGDSLAADISDPSHGGEPEGTSPEEEEPIPDAVWRRPGETVEEAEARIDEVIDAILADGGSEVEDDEDGPRP